MIRSKMPRLYQYTTNYVIEYKVKLDLARSRYTVTFSCLNPEVKVTFLLTDNSVNDEQWSREIHMKEEAETLLGINFLELVKSRGPEPAEVPGEQDNAA